MIDRFIFLKKRPGRWSPESEIVVFRTIVAKMSLIARHFANSKTASNRLNFSSVNYDCKNPQKNTRGARNFNL